VSRFFTGLFGGRHKGAAPAADLHVSTSIQGRAIPFLLAGQQRIGGNLLDYFGFAALAPKGGSGGGGKGGVIGSGGKGQGAASTTYTVSFILGLCEGTVENVGLAWVNGSETNNIDSPDAEFFRGSYQQMPWGFAEATSPSRALNYRGTAYVAAANYHLGTSPTMPQINWEVRSSGNSNNFVPGQPDGDPSVAVISLLTDQYFGLGFPANRIGTLSGTPSSWQSYCKALGFGVSPLVASSTPASTICDDLAKATNSAPCWQDGKMTFVPYGDQAVQSGQITMLTETHIVPGSSLSQYPSIKVGNSGNYVADRGVVFSGGAALAAVAFPPQTSGQYSVFPQSGYYVFNPADTGQTVLMTYTYAAAASYVPDTANLYDFTIDDFMPNRGTIGTGLGSTDSPVIVVRKPRDQMLNVVKIEYLDRNNAYNPVDIEFRDSAAIVAYKRVRPTTVKQFHMFCLASAAVQSAALQLVREQMPRTYQWTVGKHFTMILSLMKVVTLTRSNMGLARQPVRITEIQENPDQSLTITAEDFPGTAAAPIYGTEAAVGQQLGYNQDPGLINPPLVFEPTDELGRALVSGGGLMVAGAVSGQNTTIWGGCDVWATYDAPDQAGGQQYAHVGRIVGPARMGVLTATLPSVTANPTGNQTIDATSVLAVDLTESAGTLGSGTQLDATSLNTRCFIGAPLGTPGAGVGEVVAYQIATLTATSKYSLTYLVRGAYGTEANIAQWPAGTGFARLDQGVFEFPYDKTRIGSTVYLKFASFNIWQGGGQSLSSVPAYTYVIQGAALASPLPTVQNLRAVFIAGRLSMTWDEIDDFRSGVRYEIRHGDSFDGALSLGTVAHPPFPVPGNGTFWITGWCQPAAGLIVRSEAPSSIAVSAATLTTNVLATFDGQSSGWAGTFGGGAGVDTGLNAVRTGGAANILTAPVIIANAQTSQATPVGGNVLTFVSVPAGVVAGMTVIEGTTPAAIASNTTITAVTATTVTISPPVQTPGVGNMDNIVFTPADVLSLGGEQSGTYMPAFYVNVGRPCAVTITITTKGTGVPVGQNLLASNDILSMQDVLGSVSATYVDVFASVLVAQSAAGSILGEANILTDPNVLTSGVPFAAPQKYAPGDYFGQFFAFQFTLNTIDPLTIAYLLSATITIQLPTRLDHILTNGTLLAAGLAVTFTPDGSATPAAFNGGPNNAVVPAIVASWGDEQPGDVLQVTGLTLSGMTVSIVNGGLGVQRNQVNLYAEGF
jgi:hypothetical protein